MICDKFIIQTTKFFYFFKFSKKISKQTVETKVLFQKAFVYVTIVDSAKVIYLKIFQNKCKS